MSKIEDFYYSEISRDVLKEKLRPILADETLTKDERGDKLIPIMVALNHQHEDLSFDEVAALWNLAMAELVTELGLRRQ